ncbi:MAG TPA: hypothetical protein VEY88_10310 [Archangium sp.]|nr:hypothetical protein [Archangium sp.]
MSRLQGFDATFELAADVRGDRDEEARARCSLDPAPPKRKEGLRNL